MMKMNQLGGAVTPASAMKNYNKSGTNQSINTHCYINDHKTNRKAINNE